MSADIRLTKIKLGNNADTSKNFLISVPDVADGTLTITRESGTSLLSIDTSGRIALTTTVYDSGTNGNGTWVRYVDGTMMCTTSISGSKSGSVYTGGLYRYDFGVWTYPQAFIGTPVISSTSSDQLVTGFQSYANMSSTTVQLYHWTSSTTVTSSLFIPVAIGRWK